MLLAPLPPLVQPVLAQFIPQFIQQHLSAMGNESMYRLRPEYLYSGPLASMFTNSFCDTTPLRETLREVVCLEQLNHYCQVAVTAVNVATGQLANFGNKIGLEVEKKAFKLETEARPARSAKTRTQEGSKESQFTNEERLTVDHILASGSLPPNFPATCVDGSSYWDGGLYSNTPLSVAINCLESYCDCHEPAVIMPSRMLSSWN